MAFEHDIFISYAHIDNCPLNPEQEGWISTLHKALEIRLAQLQGKYPKIWRDLKLQGNDYFGDAILEKLTSAALLVSILSPRYLKSEWCIRELRSFCQEAGQTGGLKIRDHKSRLFKVVKTHLLLEQLPAEFEGILGYEFFELDEAKRPQEFDKLYGPELERKFYNKLNDLAYDIHRALQSIEALPAAGPSLENDTSSPSPMASEVRTKTIYLAEATDDLTQVRDKIYRELVTARHRVLPDQPLPMTPDFAQTVQKYLEDCDLSVHLVSPQGGSVEAAASPSAQVFQQLLAARSQEQIEIAKRCAQERETLGRVIWMPPKAKLSKADAWLRQLQSEPDFLSTPIEVLKTEIEDRLHPPAPISLPAFTASANGVRTVYLDCDQRDQETEDIDPLVDWLEQRFRVVWPTAETSSNKTSEALLGQCEAVLIYYGQANSRWLRHRLSALKKTLYDRPKPLLTKAIYLAGPATPNKQDFSDPEVPVINGLREFNPGLLEPFLAPLAGGA